MLSGTHARRCCKAVRLNQTRPPTQPQRGGAANGLRRLHHTSLRRRYDVPAACAGNLVGGHSKCGADQITVFTTKTSCAFRDHNGDRMVRPVIDRSAGTKISFNQWDETTRLRYLFGAAGKNKWLRLRIRIKSNGHRFSSKQKVKISMSTDLRRHGLKSSTQLLLITSNGVPIPSIDMVSVDDRLAAKATTNAS